jgi:CBS domain-containing protein
MTDDIIDEELQIGMEQDQEQKKVLSGEIFELPITELDLPSAVCLDESSSISEALRTMQSKRIGSIIIVKDRKLSGIVTERDILLKVAGLPLDLNKKTVKSIMTSNPTCLLPTDMIAYVMNNMHVGGYRHVPIVDENNVPLAMVSIKDVMSFILEYFPEEIQNITGEPYRGEHLRESA